MKPSLGVLLVLGGLLASSSRACKRRIEDFLPSRTPKTEFETGLFTVAKGLEVCYEYTFGATEERRQKGQEALALWDGFFERYRAAPPPGVTVEASEYALVLTSLDHYMDRIREANGRGDMAEAMVQSVAFQHVVGELYGTNPGQVSRLNSLVYTTETLAHILDVTAASVPAWRNRLQLARLRLEGWVTSSELEAAPRLRWVHKVRAHLGQVSRLGELGSILERDAAPQPALRFYGEEARTAAADLTRAVHYLKADITAIQWNPGQLPRFLDPEDPEYDPKAR